MYLFSSLLNTLHHPFHGTSPHYTSYHFPSIDLKRGAEIVVCTPGRMIDILCMQAGKMTTLR